MGEECPELSSWVQNHPTPFLRRVQEREPFGSLQRGDGQVRIQVSQNQRERWCWFRRRRKGPQVKQWRQPPEKDGKGETGFSSRGSRKTHSPGEKLTYVQWVPCQTSNLQDCKVINVYYVCFLKEKPQQTICVHSPTAGVVSMMGKWNPIGFLSFLSFFAFFKF